MTDDRARERALARTRRTGHADGVGGTAERICTAGDVASVLTTSLDERQQASPSEPVATSREGKQFCWVGDAGRHELHRDHFGDAVHAITHDAFDAGLQGLV